MKKAFYCEKLEKTLNFLPDKVNFCCSCAESPSFVIPENGVIPKNAIITTRNKFIKMFDNGIVPKECEGCCEYKQVEKQSFFKLFFKKYKKFKTKEIIINHYKQCDCDCVYCSQKILYPDTIQKYDFLPILKNLYKDNELSEDLIVEFQGGNISLLKEFDDIIYELEKNGCPSYHFLINGIKHLPITERIAQKYTTYFCISLDSGSRETFKQIKKVDAFEQVLENIKRLDENTSALIKLKYIIINGINDNVKELELFLNFASTVKNLDVIFLEIDFRDIFMGNSDKFVVPRHYYELFDFAKEYCENHKLNYFVQEHTRVALEKGLSL